MSNPKPPEPAKCQLEQVLKKSTIELLKANPNNEVARTLALRDLRQPIPEEVKSFEEIVAWVQANITPPPTPKVNPNSGIIADVFFNEMEYGSCQYERKMSGQGSYSLSPEELAELMDETLKEEGDFSALYNKVRNALRKAAVDNPPDVSEVSCETYDHDVNTTDNQDASIVSTNRLADCLRAVLNTYYREEYQTLLDNE